MNKQLELDLGDVSPVGGDAVADDSSIGATRRLIENFTKWAPQIDEALHHGGSVHKLDDVFKLAMQGRLHCYFFEKCFMIMEIAEYAQAKVYHGFLAGGDMDAILDMEEDMGNMARALGCSHLSIAGRMGWKRVFENRGWDFICVTMYKDLTK